MSRALLSLSRAASASISEEKSNLCDGGSFLLSSIDVPVQSQIVEASEEVPLLSMLLWLDTPTVREVLVRDDLPETRAASHRRGFEVGETTPGSFVVGRFSSSRFGFASRFMQTFRKLDTGLSATVHSGARRTRRQCEPERLSASRVRQHSSGSDSRARGGLSSS